MPHVDDALLHAYLDGELHWHDVDAAGVELHLHDCDVCRGRLQAVKQIRERGRMLLGAQLPVEQPPFEEVLRRAGRNTTPARRRVPGAVWAASLVLALAGGWLARGLVGGRDDVRGEDAMRAVPDSAGSPAAGAVVVAALDSSAPAPATAAPASSSSERAVEPQARPRETARPEAPDPSPPDAEPPPEATLLAGAAPSAGEAAGTVTRIEGRVTDEAGRGLVGATVFLPGIRIGTLTGPEGAYALTVPPGTTTASDSLDLVAQVLGFEVASSPVELPEGGTMIRDFRMRPAEIALEGIIATAAAPPAERDAYIWEEVGAADWAPARTEEIRDLLGRDALRIRRLDVLGVDIGWVAGERVVRVRQALPGGGVVTLLQSPGDEGEPDEREGAALDSSIVLPDGASAATTVHRGRVRIVASAPASSAFLSELLEDLR